MEEEKDPVVILPGFGGSWDLDAILTNTSGNNWEIPEFVKEYDGIINSLKNKYTDKYFRMQFTDSDKNLNLQLADFIVGTFFKNFTKSQKIPEFNLNNLKAKIISNIL